MAVQVLAPAQGMAMTDHDYVPSAPWPDDTGCAVCRRARWFHPDTPAREASQAAVPRARSLDPDAGLALADDECFCVTPTIATNEHDETWCSVCGERLLLNEPQEVR